MLFSNLSNTIFAIFFLFFSRLQLMKPGFSAFKGADIPKDLLHEPAGFFAVLPHPVAMVGIGAHRDDLAA
jgi:hypothetical protein